MNNLTPSEMVLMRKAGQITRDALSYCKTLIKPGVSTKELDILVEKFIIDSGAIPACKNYEGFPASICASVNDMVSKKLMPNEHQMAFQNIYFYNKIFHVFRGT